MRLLTRLLCLMGRHRRSRGRARRNSGRWHSRCRRCGAEMEKLDGSGWRVVDGAAKPARQPG